MPSHPLSTNEVPARSFDRVEKLSPGEIAEIEIELMLVGLMLYPGEQLHFVISSRNLLGTLMPAIEEYVGANSGQHVIHTGGERPCHLGTAHSNGGINYSNMNGADNELILPDGRKLCYAEYGDPNGLPVFYFHGAPSSRLEPEMFGDELSSSGLRIIAPDRPGIGRSDWQESRSFTNWAEDIENLADHLGWETFALLGNSGGGPYVAACAALLPERVTAAVVVSGGWRMDAPEVKANLPFVNRLFWILARRFPLGLRLLLTTMRKSGSSVQPDLPSEADLKRLQVRLPAPDVAALSVPGRMKATSASIAEALSRGTKGEAWEARMYVHPFSFDHTRIRVPFSAFHGGLDRNVPLALVEAYVAQIPNATLKVWPEDGHLSAPCNHISEVFEVIRKSSTEHSGRVELISPQLGE